MSGHRTSILAKRQGSELSLFRRSHRQQITAFLIAFVLLSSSLQAINRPDIAHAQSVGQGPLTVVLIGDSYSAGNGTGQYDGGPQGCFRSSTNWASRYSGYLADQGYQVTFINRACSGAETEHVLNRRDMGIERFFSLDPFSCPESKYPDEETLEYISAAPGPAPGVMCRRYVAPQINAVTMDADIVLFTFGGNDVNFEGIVEQCFAVGFRDPGDCERRVADANARLEAEVPGDLRSMLTNIDVRTRGDAKVVFLAYPHLVMRQGYTLVSLFGTDTYAAGSAIRTLGNKADATQNEAVTEVFGGTRGPKGYYIDSVKPHFGGFLSEGTGPSHEPDGDANRRNPLRWINEFFEPSNNIRDEWYHPNGTPVAPGESSGHEEYKNLLVREGAFGAGGGEESDASIDVVFAIDTTGSMSEDIDAVKSFSSQFVDRLASSTRSYRVGLVTYRDFPERTGDEGDFPSRVDLGFSDDKAEILGALDAIDIGSGGDFEETAYSGLASAIGLPWRPGVKKVVIQLGDAPPLSPEPVTGLTADDIVQAAREVDPAQVYVVDVSSSGGSTGDDLADIASRTGGRVIPSTSPDDVEQALQEILEEAVSEPYAWVGGPYVVQVGEALTFDGSGSYDGDGFIVGYEWDTNGDGVYDVETLSPELEHSFPAEFDGLVGLRVTDDRGLTGEATAIARATSDGDETEAELDNCPDVANHGQGDEDSDGLGDACDPTPGFPTEDKPGVSSFDDATESRECTVTGSGVIRGTSGDDIICGSDGRDTIFAGAGDDIVFSGGGNDVVLGGRGNDEVHGEAGNDRLLGQSGNDQLLGGPGDDKLVGGTGNDQLDGGDGSDHCIGQSGQDSLTNCEDEDTSPPRPPPDPPSPPPSPGFNLGDLIRRLVEAIGGLLGR